jgi:hypothetical protein
VFTLPNGKTVAALSVAAGLIMTLVGAPAVSMAAPSGVSASPVDIDAMEELFEKFGVPEAQQHVLLQEAQSGIPWDVYESGPSVREAWNADGFTYTVDRFADGSFRAVGIEDPQPASPGAVTQCSISTGSGYSNADNCQIDGVWGSVLLGAVNVDYTIVDGLPDRITDTGYGYQKCYAPTTCSSPGLVESDDVEDDGPAFARWQSDVTAAWGSWNVWFQLNVGGDRAYQSNS